MSKWARPAGYGRENIKLKDGDVTNVVVQPQRRNRMLWIGIYSEVIHVLCGLVLVWLPLVALHRISDTGYISYSRRSVGHVLIIGLCFALSYLLHCWLDSLQTIF